MKTTILVFNDVQLSFAIINRLFISRTERTIFLRNALKSTAELRNKK